MYFSPISGQIKVMLYISVNYKAPNNKNNIHMKD